MRNYGFNSIGNRQSKIFHKNLNRRCCIIIKDLRVNDKIRAREVRVIGPDGAQLGIMTPREALEVAFAQQLDLVEVAPEMTPPVCRIMDYGKHKYERSKRAKDAKKKQTVVHVKEIKMRPKTDEHDYNFKLRHIQEFLGKGHKIKVSLMFRGREMSHLDLGRKMMERLTKDLEAHAIIEQAPKLEGKNMTMLVGPRHEVKKPEGAAKPAAAVPAAPAAPNTEVTPQ